jgi:hypothetical protein
MTPALRDDEYPFEIGAAAFRKVSAAGRHKNTAYQVAPQFEILGVVH